MDLPVGPVGPKKKKAQSNSASVPGLDPVAAAQIAGQKAFQEPESQDSGGGFDLSNPFEGDRKMTLRPSGNTSGAAMNAPVTAASDVLARDAFEAQRPLIDKQARSMELDNSEKETDIALKQKKLNQKSHHMRGGGRVRGAKFSETFGPGQNSSNTDIFAGPSLNERTTPGSLAEKVKSASAGRIAAEQGARVPMANVVAQTAAARMDPGVAPAPGISLDQRAKTLAASPGVRGPVTIKSGAHAATADTTGRVAMGPSQPPAQPQISAPAPNIAGMSRVASGTPAMPMGNVAATNPAAPAGMPAPATPASTPTASPMAGTAPRGPAPASPLAQTFQQKGAVGVAPVVASGVVGGQINSARSNLTRAAAGQSRFLSSHAADLRAGQEGIGRRVASVARSMANLQSRTAMAGIRAVAGERGVNAVRTIRDRVVGVVQRARPNPVRQEAITGKKTNPLLAAR